jgi:hypothetical protein
VSSIQSGELYFLAKHAVYVKRDLAHSKLCFTENPHHLFVSWLVNAQTIVVAKVMTTMDFFCKYDMNWIHREKWVEKHLSTSQPESWKLASNCIYHQPLKFIHSVSTKIGFGNILFPLLDMTKKARSRHSCWVSTFVQPFQRQIFQHPNFSVDVV